jgi:HECT-domain (ubiquitin-transferase)
VLHGCAEPLDVVVVPWAMCVRYGRFSPLFVISSHTPLFFPRPLLRSPSVGNISTCFNRIDLPLYETKAELKEKLMLAVSMSSTGFDIE